MDAVDRETLIRLLTEVLMRDTAFRARRGHWALDADRCQLAARICAAGLVDHIYRGGVLARCSRPAVVADVTGPATVIDGDTIVVAGERIRLEGIDAPELHQTCTAYGQQWACGRTSAERVQEQLNGRRVECVGHARDRYGRLLAFAMSAARI